MASKPGEEVEATQAPGTLDAMSTGTTTIRRALHPPSAAGQQQPTTARTSDHRSDVELKAMCSAVGGVSGRSRTRA